MIRTESRLYRAFATFLTVALLNLSVPVAAIAATTPPPKPEPKGVPKTPPTRSHVLTAKELRSAQGRAGESPYLAGQNKWDVIYNGVNLMTGNYTQTATDLGFDGGYGIPVNVTRSYSSNNAEEGPFGKGWNISVDVRSTAGGVLKSPAAPVLTVPVAFKEQPTGEDTPMTVEPVKAVVATDASGQEQTIQEDVDGILTTPPWDHNVIDSTYDHVNVGGQIYDVLMTNTVRTVDGTVYVYSKHGTYASGMTARTTTGASGEPGYVLKIDSATDRQGNVTTYTYTSSSPSSFDKSNGTTTEDRLTAITMPNGHQITFVWANNASTGYRSRIVSAKDNGDVRVVNYTYHSTGMLASVTTPGGKTTSYGYGAAEIPSGWSHGEPGTLLTSITDPRGFQTQVFYQMGSVQVLPYSANVYAPVAYKVRSGVRTGALARVFVMHPDPWDVIGDPGTPPTPVPGTFWNNAVWFGEWMEGTGTLVNSGGVGFLVHPGETLETHAAQGTASSGSLAHGDADVWVRYYDLQTYDLVREVNAIRANPVNTVGPNLRASRQFPLPAWGTQAVTTTTEYNFMGNPLKSSTVEGSYYLYGSAISTSSPKITHYAYWGADKYYQQKAVVDPSGRVGFTDYFASTTAAGRRGQTAATYDSKFGDFGTYNPSSMPTGWRDSITPGEGPGTAYPMAIFYHPTTGAEGYDSKGRVRNMWKRNKSNTDWVRIATMYGSDTDGSWGQAATVWEDYGTGKINRLTETLHYTTWGKADQVRDAAGRVFETSYDLDGQIQSVTRTDVSPAVTLASYTYGASSGTVEFGQPTQVVDGLSGVTQSFTYVQPGTSLAPNYGVGQVHATSQSGGTADAYSVTYSYEDSGFRRTATYASPDGTTTWGYGDYVRVGDPTNPTPVFQTLVKLSSGVGTEEELHYVYDSAGRLMHSAFAQSKQTRSGAPTSYPYYTTAYPAETRARASYDYDPVGRPLGVSYWWDAMNTGHTAYVAAPIFKNECAYDAVKGLKTASAYYEAASGSWPLTPTTAESYTYDADRDYLTGETDTYSGGSPTTQTWSYDLAGNRNNSGYAYNDLNMMTASPGTSYVNDVLGNRTSQTTSGVTTTYSWDVVNRMTSRTGSTAATTAIYEYRADGMRTAKRVGTSVSGYNYELTRHDGQMPFEIEKISTAGAVEATRNVLGARGVDAEEDATGTISGITRTLGSATIAYPLYDAHGNRIAKIWRNGSGGWTGDTARYYDAWGNVRSGSTTGGSPMRYCASLGHLQDDESGLMYMRARYYEPTIGKFITEDPSRDGFNWYSYCNNEPVGSVDSSGKKAISAAVQAAVVAMIQTFFLTLGQAVASGEFNGVFELSAAKFAAASSFIIARAFEMLAGSEGLGARIPLRFGYTKGFSFVAASSFTLGLTCGLATIAVAAIGAYIGRLQFYFFMLNNPNFGNDFEGGGRDI